ncbi:MAG: hypothetical protein AAF567_05210 [Actinomycetota bacterium]
MTAAQHPTANSIPIPLVLSGLGVVATHFAFALGLNGRAISPVSVVLAIAATGVFLWVWGEWSHHRKRGRSDATFREEPITTTGSGDLAPLLVFLVVPVVVLILAALFPPS